MNKSNEMAMSVPPPPVPVPADVVQGAEGDEDEHYAQAESEITYSVDYEGFLAGGRRLGLVIGEPYEVVGTEPHGLPPQV
jgi:hypothetical protein